MAEIKVPELAESITEGTIAQWVKKVGDRVEKGEFIVELETDKVNAEIISEEAGVLTQIIAEEGDTVLVGQVIAVVEAGEGGAAISVESLHTGAHIDGHDIALLQHPLTGDAVDHFIVDADAGAGGIPAVTEERRNCTLFADEFFNCLVDLLGCYARPYHFPC